MVNVKFTIVYYRILLFASTLKLEFSYFKSFYIDIVIIRIKIRLKVKLRLGLEFAPTQTLSQSKLSKLTKI